MSDIGEIETSGSERMEEDNQTNDQHQRVEIKKEIYKVTVHAADLYTVQHIHVCYC